MRKILAILAALVLAACSIGVSVAAATVAAPIKAVGLCVSKSSPGAVRGLERGNLAASRHGKCTSKETKVVVPTVDGLIKGPKGDTGPAGPAPTTLTFKRGTAVETCTKDAASTTTALTYVCVIAP